ncbi:MAG: radical SAM protein [Candidatus Thorarchaeota archaeon SMTZ-45]|nr:MAG: radical SAM protein [Candidatus Thorarchaeota archaeon SMTZ1-45]KXH76732.1 MAG: radical SAM protein [Candidatus Thorarchaeota archaeon SMTZ-45]
MKVCFVIYDNDSYIHWFPQGIAYLAAVLREAGHDITIYNQDVYHYPEPHLTDYLTNNCFDVVGVGVIGGYYQYRKLLKISDAITKVEDRPRYIIGGHGPSPEPEYFLKKTGADAVVIGEGEISTPNLLSAFETGDDLRNVKGIGFMDENGECVVTDRQPLIQDLDTIPFPAYDLFPIDYYSLLRMPHINNSDRCLPIISSRGCPYRCNFCYRMDEGIRLRSPENVVQEMRLLHEDYGITYFAFADELTMVSPQRTKDLCNAFIESGLDIRWDCNGRLNFAKPEILDLMKKAGCVFINYGIESYDDASLKKMNKNLTVEQITVGIENTLEAGISPGFNIIWGNIDEDEKVLEKGVQFLLKYDDHSQMRTIRPVTPYPGSDLYNYAIERGLLKDVEDFYENKHTNSDLLAVNFTPLSDDEFYQYLFEANRKLLENYFDHLKEKMIETARILYLERDETFRGFRTT